MWVFAIVIVLALGGVALVAAGRGEPMAPAPADRRDVLVPAGRPLGPDDLRATRFTLAFRGYRMSEVDALLERVAREMEAERTATAAPERATPTDATEHATPPDATAAGPEWPAPAVGAPAPDASAGSDRTTGAGDGSEATGSARATGSTGPARPAEGTGTP